MRLLAATVVTFGLLASGSAVAQTFHIKEADFDKGEWSFESINAFQDRFPANAERIRSGHELGLGYGITNTWQLKGLLSLSTPDGESTRLERAIMENIWVFKPLAEDKDGIGVAWFQAVEVALRSDDTNLTLFGPTIIARSGKFELALNPFFGKTFGQNSTNGVDFIYGWQGRYELSKHVSIGLEGYGVIPDLGNAPRIDFQEHRIGPVLILKGEIDRGAHAAPVLAKAGEKPHGIESELELGMLFGLTEATPDVTVKANMHLKF